MELRNHRAEKYVRLIKISAEIDKNISTNVMHTAVRRVASSAL